MAIDEEIVKAIESVVAAEGQPESVGRRLLAWLEDESSRVVPHPDRMAHLKNLRDAIVTKED